MSLTWGWCGWIYVGAATGTLATSSEFGRLVTGTALTWSGIWSTSIMTGGPGWGGWCCRGTVDPILRGQKLLFVGGWKSLLCDGWWCCCCCCWTKGQPWLDECLKWKCFTVRQFNRLRYFDYTNLLSSTLRPRSKMLSEEQPKQVLKISKDHSYVTF